VLLLLRYSTSLTVLNLRKCGKTRVLGYVITVKECKEKYGFLTYRNCKVNQIGPAKSTLSVIVFHPQTRGNDVKEQSSILLWLLQTLYMALNMHDLCNLKCPCCSFFSLKTQFWGWPVSMLAKYLGLGKLWLETLVTTEVFSCSSIYALKLK